MHTIQLHYKLTTYARINPKTERPADPSLREAALLGALELLPAAPALEVGEPVPVLLLLPLALPLSEANWSAGILSVCTGGGYCVRPVQVGRT
jgi:hypothetical protein